MRAFMTRLVRFVFMGLAMVAMFAPPLASAGPDENVPPLVAQAYHSDEGVVIEWTAHSTAVPDKYRVYRSHDAISFLPIADPTDRRYVDAEVRANTTVYYQIRAVFEDGESAGSVVVAPQNLLNYPYCNRYVNNAPDEPNTKLKNDFHCTCPILGLVGGDEEGANPFYNLAPVYVWCGVPNPP